MRKLFKKIKDLFKPSASTDTSGNPKKYSYKDYIQMNGKTWMVTDIDSRLNMRYITIFNGSIWVLANCTEKQFQESIYFLSKLLEQDKAVEIKLEENPWIFPHLYLPLKNQILSKLSNQTPITHEQNV